MTGRWAQAVKGALHADRRVQQYGLLVGERSARGQGRKGIWTVRSGRGFELGVSLTRPSPSPRAYDIEVKASRTGRGIANSDQSFERRDADVNRLYASSDFVSVPRNWTLFSVFERR